VGREFERCHSAINLRCRGAIGRRLRGDRSESSNAESEDASLLSAALGLVSDRSLLLCDCIYLRIQSSSATVHNTIPQRRTRTASVNGCSERDLEPSLFRAKNLVATFALSLGYSAIVATCCYCLSRFDRFAAAATGLYGAYLVYANVWGYRVWRLNRIAP
jgi:hypothetical protein